MTAGTDNQARLTTVAEYVEVRVEVSGDLSALCELATLLCEVPHAEINLIDDKWQRTIAAFGDEPDICAIEESMCAVSLSSDDDVYVEDARDDPRFASNPWVDGRLGEVRMYAAALLRAPSGHAVGTICVYDTTPPRVERRRGLPDRRRHVLTKLAAQVVDVFELHVRTLNLDHTVRELARSQEQLAAFAGQVSHDLKTPLTATLGFAELLSELPSVVADPVAARYVNRCLASSRRMLTMIDELLGYARLGGTLDRRTIPLDQIVPAVLEDLGELATQGEVRWSGADVVADRAQLHSLLQNLIGNALTYRRPDVPCTVIITSTETPIGLELTVADNGCGIPSDRRQDALLPLTRVRTDIPGTGLGLATCSRIAAVHGGSLTLGETPGGGTTVTVILPH